MRSFQRRGLCGLALGVLVLWALPGCRPTEQPGGATPGPSTTVPPSVTVPPTDTVPTDTVPTDTPTAGQSPAPQQRSSSPAATSTPAALAGVVKLVPIDLELPAPAFRGTPKPQNVPHVEQPRGKLRPPFLAPQGTVNLAGGKPVSASDPVPASGELDYVTDGDKEASDFGYLELRPGTEWVQVDLGARATIYAVVVWHNHAEARVYRDVIVQVSDDPDFLDPQTVFNNDYDNSSGMGIGRDLGYVETSEGKLVDCRGVEGRYVRLYSRGSHLEEKNHYTEVEVYGRPAS